MNKWITFLLFILLTLTSCPQVHGGIQRFIHIAKGPCGFVSKRYFETGTIWHAEARYNYEDQNTNSRNEGNHFVYLKWKPLSISPVTGIVFASFIDGNISSKINEGCKKLSISLEAQFSFCFGKKSKNLSKTKRAVAPPPPIHLQILSGFQPADQDALKPYLIQNAFQIKRSKYVA